MIAELETGHWWSSRKMYGKIMVLNILTLMTLEGLQEYIFGLGGWDVADHPASCCQWQIFQWWCGNRSANCLWSRMFWELFKLGTFSKCCRSFRGLNTGPFATRRCNCVVDTCGNIVSLTSLYPLFRSLSLWPTEDTPFLQYLLMALIGLHCSLFLSQQGWHYPFYCHSCGDE